MKLPLSWLRSWVELAWSDRELAERLTMLGFEAESLAKVAPEFSGVQVAEIRTVEAHPQAAKLRVCRVHDGRGAELQIVCGASNARAGMRTALASVGARLPGDVTIAATKIRGIESQGMLCSARELGLGEAGEGILELDADAPLGAPLRDYLHLDEALIEISVTPNRGDAMSVLGIARELAAASGAALRPAPEPTAPQAKAMSAERFPVTLTPGAGCPRFASRVIRGVDNRRAVPQWLRERLERSGLRSISPVVDVTNFVLLELGQPLHAYDLREAEKRRRTVQPKLSSLLFLRCSVAPCDPVRTVLSVAVSSVSSVHVTINDRSNTAGCTALTPVKCATCCRHDKPDATRTASGAMARAAGSRRRSPI